MISDDCSYFLIDHGNPETQIVYNVLYTHSKVKGHITIVQYQNSYIETLLLIANLSSTDYVWVCSSICKYSEFVFDTKDTLENYITVFPSGQQKEGDTFYFRVENFKEKLAEQNDLRNVGIHYANTTVERTNCPTYFTTNDTHTQFIKHDFEWPYASLTTCSPDKFTKVANNISLWDKKTLVSHTSGSTTITVPREAKNFVKNELYDYPFLVFENGPNNDPLDIVFISNGEKNADQNYEHLVACVGNLPNRLCKVENVEGRANAYKAAANASNSPWFFAVFAKLWVDENFDWSWQPDRLQIPKHYIFYAKNPVNDLVYGHQAMIAYNKKLVLANQAKGLDFTLDDPHAVVEIVSGTARYATDAFSAWRAAFREAIKLAASTDEISKTRLNTWCSVGKGEFGYWSTQGAKDGLEYYNQAKDFALLKLSYEWKWLKEKFNEKYT